MDFISRTSLVNRANCEGLNYVREGISYNLTETDVFHTSICVPYPLYVYFIPSVRSSLTLPFLFPCFRIFVKQ
jgi:hypothetical protein